MNRHVCKMVSACEEVRETDKTRASLSLSVIDLSFLVVYAGMCVIVQVLVDCKERANVQSTVEVKPVCLCVFIGLPDIKLILSFC